MYERGSISSFLFSVPVPVPLELHMEFISTHLQNTYTRIFILTQITRRTSKKNQTKAENFNEMSG